METNITTRVIRSVAEIEQIRGTWESWQVHPNTDIDFFLANLKTEAPHPRPYVVMSYRGSKPESMLVGRILDRRMDIKVGYANFFRPRVRTLSFSYAGHLGTDSAEGSAALVSQIVSSLSDKEADLATLKGVKPESPLLGAALHLPGVLSRDRFPGVRVHRSLVLPGTFEEFQLSLSGDERREQRRCAKRLVQECSGDLKIERLSEPADVDRLFRDVEEVAKKTYQRGLGVGFADTPNLRQLFLLDAERGRLYAYVLYLAGKPCAFWIGTLYGCKFHSGYMGYDPAFRRYSLGTYLLIRVIEAFYGKEQAHRVSEIDFGLGDAQYKEMLGNRSWQEANIYVFAPTLKGVGLNAYRSPAILLDRCVRKALERTQLLQRVKRTWRRRAAKAHQLPQKPLFSGANRVPADNSR